MSNTPSVIRFEGDNSNIIYRHHIEDFNTKSQLIVNESQEAIFFKDGQALDLFGSGRHTLDTDNLPLFRRFFGKLFGGTNPFQCEVYFINKVSVLDIMWGTDAPITLEDPKYGLIIDVKANGQMGIRVADARKFIVNVSGQLRDYDVETIKRQIKGMVLVSIKEVIANAIITNRISILDVTANIGKISQDAEKSLNEKLSTIGLEAVHFYANRIFADSADLEKLRSVKEKRLESMSDIDIDAMRTMRMSEAEAYKRKTEGYTYQDERRFDVMSEAAKNEGPGSAFMNMGMGMGVGAAMGGQIRHAAAEAFAEAKPATVKCPQCQATVEAGAKFCPACAAPLTPPPQPAADVCPSCNAAIPAGAKFCSECGAKIVEKKRFCSECGAEAAPGARFCSECGNKF